MCRSCGGTCGSHVMRRPRRVTIDVNQAGRRLRIVDAGGPMPLTVIRPLALEHGAALATWTKRCGFKDVVEPADMHVTVAFSRTPVDWFAFASWSAGDDIEVPAGGPRRVEVFGDGAVVLRFASPALERRWSEFKDGGCSWDWPGYAPHVTMAADVAGVDPGKLRAYTGPLLFGPELFAPMNAE